MSKESRGTCHFLGNSHIDAAWLWRFKDTPSIISDAWSNILNMMEKHSAFCFCQGCSLYYAWMEAENPELFAKVKAMVAEGRWELVGGTYVEPDCNLSSGESLVRHFLYGKRYFREKFAVDVKVAWMPDSFGYAWTLPQIMKKSGLNYFLTQKMNWNDATAFPYYFFRWISPDGTSIIAHQTVGTYSEKAVDEQIAQQITMLQSRQKIDDLLVLFGEGDHKGGVLDEVMKRVLAYVRGDKPVRGEFTTAQKYFQTLTQEVKEIPEINDELYLQYHRGTYTTQAKVKENNRKAECLLETAEKLTTIAELYGCNYNYPREELEESWKKLLLNQFHDVLGGSSVPEVYTDAEALYNSIFNTLNTTVSQALKTIAENIDTRGEGESLLVFNALAWPRSGAVEIQLDSLDEVEIYDDEEQIVPSQVLDDGVSGIVFIARDVPSIGYREYRIKRAGNGQRRCATNLFCEEESGLIRLGNEFLDVRVSKETGLVESIYDKANSREVLKASGNKVQVFEDAPVAGRTSVLFPMDASIFDAWELYIYQQPNGVKYAELKEPLEIKIIENGPVRATVAATYKYCQDSRPDSIFTQKITLHHDTPLVEFSLHVDWHAAHRLAKLAFPLNVRSDVTAYEIPYGFIERRNPLSADATLAERAKYEVPCQKWLDHSDSGGGYGVALLNASKYGFDVFDDTVRMTLLRSAQYPLDIQANLGFNVNPRNRNLLTDQGEHRIRYALYPHLDGFREALTTRRAYDFNYPLIAFAEPSHRGSLGKRQSFIAVQPDNIILTVVKKAEDTNDMVLRLYETSEKKTDATIKMFNAVEKAAETDLMEAETRQIQLFNNQTISLQVAGCEIKTIKISLKKETAA